MKPFSIDNMTTTSDICINVTDVTIQDARTGEITKHTFYRPGKRFPMETIGQELAEYGYKLMAVCDPIVIEGRMPWNEVFATFAQQEGSPA